MATTLDEFVQELKNRGFEGFAVGDLQRYLDWGFRKIVRMANWDWEQDKVGVVMDPGEYKISLGIVGVGDPGVPLLRDLTKIIDTTTGQTGVLAPISEEKWAETWLTTDLSSVGVRGVPHEYFFKWQDAIYLLPPPVTARTYDIYYYKYIGAASEGILAMPEDWEEAELLAAEGICHYRARQPEFGREADLRLSEILSEMMVEQNMKDPDFQERVDSPWSRVR